jgi:hypothetical protein
MVDNIRRILHSLECGFFMSHREQEEAADLIRTLVHENDRMKSRIIEALKHLQLGTELDVNQAIKELK